MWVRFNSKSFFQKHIFKGYVKILKIYLVKFNITTFQWPKNNGVFINKMLVHINKCILNKTVTKLFTIFNKCFLPILNPASYLKFANLLWSTISTKTWDLFSWWTVEILLRTGKILLRNIEILLRTVEIFMMKGWDFHGE